MPKRVNDDPGDELTGMDQGDRSGAAEAGRAALDADTRAGDDGDSDSRDDGVFDPTSRDNQPGEVL
jgi:hypothetical protein